MTVNDFQNMLGELQRTLDDRSDKLGVLDSLLLNDRLVSKTIPTTMPVPMGYYSSNYGYRLDPINGKTSFHTGVDLIAPPGTPVVAAAGGVVQDPDRHASGGQACKRVDVVDDVLAADDQLACARGVECFRRWGTMLRSGSRPWPGSPAGPRRRISRGTHRQCRRPE
jgi:hypothetical protein